jgi:putative acetyltransferase
MIEIVPYSDEYAAVFKVLNLEWLDKYNLTESHDLMILNNPKGTIIDTGGVIYLAKSGEEIIGSAALINEGHGIFELAKMAVAPASRGKGISKLLIEKCIDAAKERKAKKIILFSNSQLQTAISLYKKYGFKHVDVTDAPFLTADIKMELSL